MIHASMTWDHAIFVDRRGRAWAWGDGGHGRTGLGHERRAVMLQRLYPWTAKKKWSEANGWHIGTDSFMFEVKLHVVWGKIGSAMDTLLLFNCFQWDPETGAYVADAWKLMRLGGVVTIIVLAVGIVILAAKGPRHRDPGAKPPSDGFEWHRGDPVGGEA